MPKMRADRDRTEFGRRMYQARTDAGLTQEVAAKLIGVKQTTLSGWEGVDKGSSHTAKAAEVYGVSATWLATGEGPREVVHNPGAEEAALLAAFRKLKAGGNGRVKAIAFLEGLAAGESSGEEIAPQPERAPKVVNRI